MARAKQKNKDHSKPEAEQNSQPSGGPQETPKPEAPMSEAQRVMARKKLVMKTLSEKFNEETWRTRLMLICGGDESRIVKALQSFLTYIMNDEGGHRHQSYIADCAISTISACFLESFQMGIEVGGGRDHAYLLNYNNICELEISYKGFVYALSKHFDNAFVSAGAVFEGDVFTTKITDNTATYTHEPKDPFAQTWEKLRGVYCYFSYTNRQNGEKVSRLIMVHKDGPDSLMMIRSKAKTQYAWNDFPLEMAKKSVLRRAAKIPFASVDFADDDINPEEVDNRRYRLGGEGGSEKLKMLMDRQAALQEDDKPKEAANAPVNPTTDGQVKESGQDSISTEKSAKPLESPPTQEILPPEQAQNDPEKAVLSDEDFEGGK